VNDITGVLFSPWGWLSLAAVAAGLEILLPGAFMIWIAAAALATAVTVALLPLTLDGQLAAFAVWILVALLASRRFARRRPRHAGDAALNRLDHRVAGQVAVVTEAIAGGRGRVRLGDSEWLAQGPDAPAGARVRVLGADGAILKVAPEAEPASALPQPDPDDPA
jgi:hypothetical protein